MIYISFLIPVYNQSEDVRNCIYSIVNYQGNDIEIVVNDDNSTENIEKIVEEFHDDRIVYYKNKENCGLDGNILEGIERCKGRFVFILRTTDYAISDAIPSIIEVIKKNLSVVYITGTCIDDDGLPRKVLDEGIVQQGGEALQVHWKLHFHPSGSLFRKDCIDINLYKMYWEQFKMPRIYFMVEQLMRLRLATLGDFYLINKPIWVYTYTNRKVKKSVHNNNNIYDPTVSYYRYRSEQEFMTNELDDEFCVFRRIQSLEMWLNAVTWSYLSLMHDEGLCKHYGISQKEVDVAYERKEFLKFVTKTEKEFGYDNTDYLKNKKKIIEDNIAFEHVYRNEITFRQKAYNAAKDTVVFLEKMAAEKKAIKEILIKKKYERIGIYGVGYLGKILYVFLKQRGIDPIYVTDKKFCKMMWLNKCTRAIPTTEISKCKVDVLVITPVQYYDEIYHELEGKVNMTSVIDMFSEG